MLVGVVQERTMKDLADTLDGLSAVDCALYDMLELRLDACEDLNVAELAKLFLPLPVIITLRRKEEGGAYKGSEQERLILLEELIQLHPDFIDLEAAIADKDLARIRGKSPATKVLLSAHNFIETPADPNNSTSIKPLETMLTVMQSKVKANSDGVIYKIACYANSTLDTLRMFVFCKKYGDSVLGISMGEKGITSRILAPVLHAGICYCPLGDFSSDFSSDSFVSSAYISQYSTPSSSFTPSAPGQLSALELRDTYNAKKLNKDTAIYGLLGDPVEQSMGHMFHNSMNAKTFTNAVYVKWQIDTLELPVALRLLHYLGVQGLSVTMPLKEALVSLLVKKDMAVQKIGASNTLLHVEGGYAGTNTDGVGVVRALGMNLHGKKVVILGAGGAARAIMYEIYKHTTKVFVFNRTVDKKIPVPIDILPFSCLSDVKGKYDVIINTLPYTIDFSFASVPFHEGSVAMDISYGKKSIFLEKALEAGCRVITGKPMFVEQALCQRELWGQATV